ISDRWLPVSPVTGAVDGFEWKAPVDAIGRGDDTLVIEERPAPATVEAPPPLAPRPVEIAPRVELIEVSKESEDRPASGAAKPPAAKPPAAKPQPTSPIPPARPEPKPKPAIFVPERPPDDPGVAQAETDESPSSLERFRTAQFR
ncbi:MAG: hypothetical protein AB7V40_09310, partial [Methyloceanibacter sp.]